MAKAKASLRGGFTMSELVEELSELHDLEPSKAFRRQVALALRRGLSYGILVKSRNKYRFDPEASLTSSLQKSKRMISSKKSRRNSKDKPVARTTSKSQKAEKPRVPKPTVPPLPNFTPKPRNLVNEPFKVIRHQPASRK